MYRVPTPPLLTNYYGAFKNGSHLFSSLFGKTASTELKVVLFLWFICGTEFGMSELLRASRFRALQYENNLGANERVLILLSKQTNANIVEQRLLKMISDSEGHPVAAILTISRTNKID